jgi:hypothetical protein
MKPAITTYNLAKHLAESGHKDVHEFAIVMLSPDKAGVYHAITGVQINRQLKTVVLTTERIYAVPKEEDLKASRLNTIAKVVEGLGKTEMATDPLVNAKAPECQHFWYHDDKAYGMVCSKCNAFKAGATS